MAEDAEGSASLRVLRRCGSERGCRRMALEFEPPLISDSTVFPR